MSWIYTCTYSTWCGPTTNKVYNKIWYDDKFSVKFDSEGLLRLLINNASLMYGVLLLLMQLS